MVENAFIYLIGTAGSGKSKLTHAANRYMTEHSLDGITVNLDPGAETLPYEPDVDIRDWIRLADVMAEYGLGPNGAQVVAADLLATRADDVLKTIESFRSDYVFLDTPGQTELFIFREAGKFIVENFAPDNTMVAFVIDPFLAKTAGGFVSQLLLSATTQFRFQVPMVNILSKSDLLEEAELERIVGWAENTDLLYDAVAAERTAGLYSVLNTDLLHVLQTHGSYSKLIPVSSETFDGLDDLYSNVQSALGASEDLVPR